MSDTVHNAQTAETAETAPVVAQGGHGQEQASSTPAGAGNDYVTALENAVLDAEWWMAHPQVAARKDPRGERKRAVYKAADAVRERRWQTEAVPATATPSLLASLVAIKDLLEDGTDKETSPSLFVTPAEQAIDLINAMITQAQATPESAQTKKGPAKLAALEF